MRLVADLHIHGRYARATSKDLTIPNLEKWARIKGIGLLGTGDFTHPLWLKELKESLVEENGILRTKSGMPFVLQTEISLIYNQKGKGRRIHNIVLAPSFRVVEEINVQLSKKGRLDYDGRPMFGISCPSFVELMKEIDDRIEIIPAHAWTPWFSLFGSMSGFDSLKECFEDRTKDIHAIETGLSSDPAMNWRISQLDNVSILSFSDSHSYWPWRIGREVTVFDVNEISYDELIKAIRCKKVIETIEFFPEEGKYHYDGHRNCGVCLSPKETAALKKICPKCAKPVTIGVAHRVEELADRPEGYKPDGAADYKKLIPLSELIAGIMGSAVYSKKVWQIYNKLIERFGTEFAVLISARPEELTALVDEKIVNAILANREQRITFKPGFDGEYGKPILDAIQIRVSKEQTSKSNQKAIFSDSQTSLNSFS
ncbi:MAG: endonuclease Q family protein [Candidatus Woesearchaeota archaeon]